jgi:hypothetical protein
MRLRLVLSSLLSTVAFASQLAAQSETPRYEMFGGYSYSRLAHSYVPLGGDTNFNGWNASIDRNINRWFGVVADVSGHYSSSFAEGYFFTTSANLYAYRFGTKFTRRGRITPFAQALSSPAELGKTGVFQTHLLQKNATKAGTSRSGNSHNFGRVRASGFQTGA